MSWFSQYCSRLPPNSPLGMAQRGRATTTARKKKANIARHMPSTRGGSTKQQSSSCSAQHIFFGHVPPVRRLMSVGAAVGVVGAPVDGRGVGSGVGSTVGAGVSAPRGVVGAREAVGAGLVVGASVDCGTGTCRSYQLPQRSVFFEKPSQVGSKSFLVQPAH